MQWNYWTTKNYPADVYVTVYHWVKEMTPKDSSSLSSRSDCSARTRNIKKTWAKAEGAFREWAKQTIIEKYRVTCWTFSNTEAFTEFIWLTKKWLFLVIFGLLVEYFVLSTGQLLLFKVIILLNTEYQSKMWKKKCMVVLWPINWSSQIFGQIWKTILFSSPIKSEHIKNPRADCLVMGNIQLSPHWGMW